MPNFRFFFFKYSDTRSENSFSRVLAPNTYFSNYFFFPPESAIVCLADPDQHAERRRVADQEHAAAGAPDPRTHTAAVLPLRTAAAATVRRRSAATATATVLVVRLQTVPVVDAVHRRPTVLQRLLRWRQHHRQQDQATARRPVAAGSRSQAAPARRRLLRAARNQQQQQQQRFSDIARDPGGIKGSGGGG